MNLLRMALSVMRFPPPFNPSEVGIDFAPEKNWGKHLVAGYKGWWNPSAWEAVPLSSIFSMPCFVHNCYDFAISHESFTLHMRGGIGKILHLERNYMSIRHIQYL